MSAISEDAIVAFVLQNAPAVYVGELLEAPEGANADEIVMGKPMVLMTNMKTQETLWTKAIACGKESVMVINQKAIPGILVVKPDPDLVNQYKTQYMQSYSSLTLLRP